MAQNCEAILCVILALVLTGCSIATNTIKLEPLNTYTLSHEAQTSWNTGIADSRIYDITAADLDDDGTIEIIVVGSQANHTLYDPSQDYPVYDAFIRIYHQQGSSLNLITHETWPYYGPAPPPFPFYTYGPAGLDGVVVGDPDMDDTLEIVAVGYERKGTGQSNPFEPIMVIWTYDHGNLIREKKHNWTQGISTTCVALGDVNLDARPEIIVGETTGSARLHVFNYSGGVVNDLGSIGWSSAPWGQVRVTVPNKLWVADIDGDVLPEIISGGYAVAINSTGLPLVVSEFAELKAFTFLGNQFVQKYSVLWSEAFTPRTYLIIGYAGNTVGKVLAGDFDNDNSIEIITIGRRAVTVDFIPVIREEAELVAWSISGRNFSRETDAHWRSGNTTYLHAGAIGDIDRDGAAEIITSGYSDDGKNAHIRTWDYSIHGVFSDESQFEWTHGDPTHINATCAYDADGDGIIEILTGGLYAVNRSVQSAELTVLSVTGQSVTGTVISGTARDSDHNPLGGVTISGGGQQTITAPDGSYLLRNVNPGTYSVTAAKPGYNGAARTVTITAGQVLTGIDFVLTRKIERGNITGTVTNTTGAPIQGASITACYAGTYTVAGSATTDANGHYTIPNLLPVSYDVTASKQPDYRDDTKPCTVPPGQTVTLDFVLQPNPGSISGMVTTGGQPLQGATVSAYYAGTNTFAGGSSTGPTGDYLISGLNPGRYDVQASMSGYITSSKQTVTVTAGSTTSGINFDLQPLTNAGWLEGYVTDAGNGTAIRGASLSIAGGPSTYTSSTGYYNFTLAPGTYELTAAATGYKSQTKTGIAVSTNRTTRIDFALIPLAALRGWVEGYVKNKSNLAPIPGATVEVPGVASAITNQAGYYNISIDPGNYNIRASAAGYRTETKTVSVTPKNSTRLDFELEALPPGWVWGIVQDVRGSPLSGAQVSIYDTATQTLVNSMLTSTDGKYNFTVRAGVYDINAAAPDYNPGRQNAVNIASGQTRQINFYLTPGTGWISGIVTDAKSGRALRSVSIMVYESDRPELKYSTMTDSIGKYNISVRVGRYDVNATLTSYEPGRKTGIVVNMGRTSNVSFVLTPYGWIYGSIADIETGAPVSQANIKIFVSGDTIPKYSTKSDTNGNYNISVPAGNYDINVTAALYELEQRTGIAVEMAAGTNVSFSLVPKPGYITGMVRNAENGTIVPRAEIVVYKAGIQIATGTAINGAFNITLSRGQYDIKCTAAGYREKYIRNRSVEPTRATFIDIRMHPLRGWVCGTVKDAASNAPVAGATVVVYTPGTSKEVARGQTTASGLFNLTLALERSPDRFEVVISAENYHSKRIGVNVSDGKATTIEIVLQKKIEGKEDLMWIALGTVVGLVLLLLLFLYWRARRRRTPPPPQLGRQFMLKKKSGW